MQPIPPYSLWLGSVGDLRDWRRLYALGISAVVQLAYEELPLPLPHDFVSCRSPLNDGSDNPPEILALAITTVTQILEQKLPCLICCQAGLSRSPALAAAVIARYTQQPFAAGLDVVSKQHPCSVHPELLRQIQAFFETT